ncbi:MAG TPA: GNAT family N-acetyltransferase [Pseudonocardiaceae bacterium]|jgi:GNAT superfamily N-acetyltransferase|nr:GNAT family N-acetyltransferase [Pseudonocardiaceae bacterium]
MFDAGPDWRPLRRTDATEFHALLAAVEKADRTGEHLGLADVAEALANPSTDFARDTIAAFDEQVMVAYASTLPLPASTVDRMFVESAAHPSWRDRGAWDVLLDWLVRRGTEWHAGHRPDLPSELYTVIHEPNQGKRDAFAAHGFTVGRWYFAMHRDLTADIPPVGDEPTGLTLLPFAAEYDSRVHAAHREAFADHFGSSPPDDAVWRQRYTGSRMFRPAMSFVVVDGDEVAGYLLGYESDADTAAKGFRAAWVGQVGTRRAWRGRGVAGTLLRQFLGRARDAGCIQAELSVDNESPTGALGLYERHGFVAAQTWLRYVRTV